MHVAAKDRDPRGSLRIIVVVVAVVVAARCTWMSRWEGEGLYAVCEIKALLPLVRPCQGARGNVSKAVGGHTEKDVLSMRGDVAVGTH